MRIHKDTPNNLSVFLPPPPSLIDFSLTFHVPIIFSLVVLHRLILYFSYFTAFAFLFIQTACAHVGNIIIFVTWKYKPWLTYYISAVK